ncbi:MAG: PLDc N-terminal domain-containing protein [Desulfovibrionaceae bacterium]|nr:PLDc N-terminal domain-containing protein [Desulfovibrionaceae bacterium]
MQFSWWYVLIAVLPLPNLWSIWHIWSHEFASFQQKVGWLCFVVFVPVLAGLIYIFYGKRFALQKIKRAA